jgi:hypothetical protein
MAEITIDDKYVSSTAYHESGHAVVAAVQGMPLRNLGVHMDSQGCGKTFYWHRVPDGSRNNAGSGIERERTIVATSAGYVAQKRFYSDTLSEDVRMQMDVGAQSDTTLVVELLEEMYSGDRNALSAARLKLFAESAQLVEKHWKAIDTLAKNLLAKEWTPRKTEADAEGYWSKDNREKWLNGSEVVTILKTFGISASVVEDSVRTYSPTLKPEGNTFSF